VTRASTFLGLLAARDLLGSHYGSEDLCLLLHALARRERPAVVVELGTGLGVTTLWLAAALEENGSGHLWSVDNGAHLGQLDPVALDDAAAALGFEPGPTMQSFARALLDANHLGGRVTLVDATVDFAEAAEGRLTWALPESPIDWVFSDIRQPLHRLGIDQGVIVPRR
jgi:predicted O-methyltransferase YrrM